MSSVQPEKSDLWMHWRQRVEQSLDALLPDPGTPSESLHAAMRYAALDGGKRLRAVAVYATGRVFAVPEEQLDRSAAAIEMVHAYSLVHDDLPAMDDDDLRRGKPSCHRAFDEPTAILAGDALQSLAFEVLAGDPHLAADTRTQIVASLAAAIGPAGMAGGQALDIAAETMHLDRPALEAVHARKTGALIRASVRIGALTATDRAMPHLEVLDDYASAVGLAFQIIDDVLDEEGDTATLGKASGSDRKLQKSTYVSLLGVENARIEALRLRDHALARISALGDNAQALAELAEFAVARSY